MDSKKHRRVRFLVVESQLADSMLFSPFCLVLIKKQAKERTGCNSSYGPRIEWLTQFG